MAQVFKYFKKKIQPFKVCVANNPSPGFDQINNSISKQAELVSESKKIKNKRTFNIKLKRSLKLNINCIKKTKLSENVTPEKIDSFTNNTQSQTEKMDISTNLYEEKSDILTPDTILFTSPVSINKSNQNFSSFYQQNSKIARIDYGETNFALSPLEDDFFDNHHSNIDHHRASCSTYDVDCLVFKSVTNSTPENVSNTSMVTYNTKYANSNLSNEDGLLSNSVSLIRQPSISLSNNNNSNNSNNNNIQQSTPYSDNLIRARNITIQKKHSSKIKKSQTTNFDSINKLNEPKKETMKTENAIYNENTLNRKCRRSNTTYTLAGKSSRIIEYFSNLEPLKRKAFSRNTSRQTSKSELKFEKKDISTKNDEFLKIFTDIEKLQDAFFNDSSLTNNKLQNNNQETSISNESAQNKNLFIQNNYLATMTPPSSSINSSNTSSNNKSQTLSDSNDFGKFNKQNSINTSIEKFRRTISLPGIVNQNSIVLANVSKISDIKESPTLSHNANSNKELTTNSNMTETLVNRETSTSTNTSLSSVEFVRGELGTRSSKKIRKMFKNVIKKQMNALNTLEKFYEAQISKIEEDRAQNLNLNPTEKDAINEYFDSQLKLLEDRVQSNLKYITENKNKTRIIENEDTEHAKKVLTHRLSQLMLLKHIQQTQQQSLTQNRSKALTDLKNSLINQQNLLPSKLMYTYKSVESQNDANFIDMNETQNLKETMFKRNLSLPFKQCRNNPLLVQNSERSSQVFRRVSKSPRMSSLAYSSSRAKFNKQSTLTSSPLTTVQSKSDFQSKTVQLQQQSQTNTTQFQYQKNNSNKKLASNENLNLRKTSIENSHELLKSLSQTTNTDSSLNIVENSTVIIGSKFAQIKRQNKSVSSIRTEQRQENFDNFCISSYFKNSSLFGSNSNLFENNNQINSKYSAPRLSDGHIQYKLRMANKNEFSQNSQYVSHQSRVNQLSETRIRSKSSILVIETEV